MLKISEIFLSIQGESSYSGLPCIFIRLSGCNLNCNYCDTKYANNNFEEKSIEEILNLIEKYKPVNLVEITGGEPLIQKQVYQLFDTLLENDYKVLLETNGSINLKNVPKEIVKIIDIKTPSSNEGDSFNYENLSFLNKKDEIKIVLSNRSDYLWAKKIIDKKKLIEKNILFSSVANEIQPKEIVSWIIEDRLNVRFQIQIHKYIWAPDKKGV